MKLIAIAVVMMCGCGWSQEQALVYAEAGHATTILATCASPDPNTAEVRDCKIADGHTLDEVINFLLKERRDSDARHVAAHIADLDDALARVRAIQASLNRIKVPHPIKRPTPAAQERKP